MKVLVACEYSGVVRDAFIREGHEAISCDLLPSESNLGEHYQGDARDIIDDSFDLLIAHPPCTYLCNSGVSWLKKDESRWQKLDEAADFFRLFLEAPIPKICVENPVMHRYALERIGGVKQTQSIQPYQFGHDASKKTCLWLKNLPKLESTKYIEPRIVNGLKRWSNQTDSGQNNLGPSENRWKIRSATYEGVAKAMAKQWSC